MSDTIDTKLRAFRAEITRLESGKLSLEDALATYERGVAIGRELDVMLARAEQQVEVINPDGTREPFPRKEIP